jgi:NtrC-family two-component system sensor histidine kinase KinB
MTPGGFGQAPKRERTIRLGVIVGTREELLAQKRNLEPLLVLSPTAIVLTDLEANVVAWNPAAERLFGYAADEALGHNLDDLVAKSQELHAAAVSISERASHKDSVTTITRRTRKDGTLVDVGSEPRPSS